MTWQIGMTFDLLSQVNHRNPTRQATAMTNHLTAQQLETFEADGVLVLRSFFDVSQEIMSIQRGVYDIIGLLLEKYGLQVKREPFTPGNFDQGYFDLIGKDRKIGGEIYDAIKQIPAFLRYCAQPRLAELTRQIFTADCVGIAAQGYGIRIDNPNEEQFRATWHQDYTTQFRSKQGLVFWTPLLTVTPEMGPVEFCVGSHKAGPVRVYDFDPNHPQKTGAYAITLENEEETVGAYEIIAPLTRPGDLVILDYMMIHRSGYNTSTRSRWSMQVRYFNYREPSGLAHGWKGGTTAGVPINDVHPGLLIEKAELQ